MATPSANQLRRISLQIQVQVVVVNVMLFVLPGGKGKGKEVLREEFATLTLTMGKKKDIVMLGSSMVPYHNMEEVELSKSIMDLEANRRKSQIGANNKIN